MTSDTRMAEATPRATRAKSRLPQPTPRGPSRFRLLRESAAKLALAERRSCFSSPRRVIAAWGWAMPRVPAPWTRASAHPALSGASQQARARTSRAGTRSSACRRHPSLSACLARKSSAVDVRESGDRLVMSRGTYQFQWRTIGQPGALPGTSKFTPWRPPAAISDHLTRQGRSRGVFSREAGGHQFPIEVPISRCEPIASHRLVARLEQAGWINLSTRMRAAEVALRQGRRTFRTDSRRG